MTSNIQPDGQLITDGVERAAAPAPGVSDVPDPFDPARLRLTQDFTASAGVQRAIMTVPVKKPAPTWFVQVHPAPEYRLETAVLELKDEQATYLVAPSLWKSLSAEPLFGPRQLLTAVNRQGVVFIWPLRMPREDRRLDLWGCSALEAAKLATAQWVRVVANLTAGQYDAWVASTPLAAPAWPTMSFQDLLKIAFRDRLIETADHPVLQKLEGRL
jgi:hypothetical protein